MSNDDDSFLSACLDGELDPESQQRLDSALVANPDLAERLRSLSVVRELVAGLSRDSSIDVGPAVMSQIRVRQRSRSLLSHGRRWKVGTRQAAALAGVLTIAAGVAIAITLTTSLRPRALNLPPGVGGVVDNAIDDSKSSGEEKLASFELQPRPVKSSERQAATPNARDTMQSAVKHELATARVDGQGDLEISRSLLDGPQRRRVFLSKSGGDRSAQQQVASVVEHTARAGFVKITVSQGIVIDPRHPEEATVFALLVSPGDLDRLRDQLRVALPDIKEESTADPAIVTQLADIGRVQALAPSPLGEVSISREGLALRAPSSGTAENAGQPGPMVSSGAAALPTAEQFRSAPLPVIARSGEPEGGGELTAADQARRVAESSAAAGGYSPRTISGEDAAMGRPDSGSRGGTAPKSADEMLVFVWICKPRAS